MKQQYVHRFSRFFNFHHRYFFLLLAIMNLAGINASAQNVVVVDPSGNGDHTTISAALDAISGTTVTQPTIIRIKAGVYTDRLVLENVSGTSAQRSIVIESFSGDTADVLISHDTASMFPARAVFELRQVSHVTIRNLSFKAPVMEGNIIGIDENANHITITGNSFRYNNSGYKSSAIGLLYNFMADDFTLDSLFITHNYCLDMFLYTRYLTVFELDYLEFSHNTVVNKRGFSDAPLFYAGSVVISHNTFENTPMASISDATHLQITGNQCITRDVAIYVSQCGRDGDPVIIANNFISQIKNTAILINHGNVRVWNNNIYSYDSSGPQNFVLYLSSTDSLQILNNNIVGLGSRQTAMLFSDTLIDPTFRCDYNNYYFRHGSISGYLNSQSVFEYVKTVNGQITRFGIDSNSISVDPLYVSETDLHVRNGFLAGKGLHITELTHDFDGDERDPDNPFIGADAMSGSIDLVPVAFNSFTGTFYPGKSIEIAYEVKNSGALDLSSIEWKDNLYLSTDQNADPGDILLKTVANYFYVGSGNSYNRKQSVSLPYVPGGTYYILLKVNSTLLNFEDHGNNLLVSGPMTMPVAQFPDLEVTTVTVPSSLYSGKSFSLEWTVKNTGPVATSGTWSDYVYVASSLSELNSPSLQASDSLLKVKVEAPSGLKPNESYTASSTFHVPIKFSGNLYYRVQTNGNNGIVEQDTSFTNNGMISSALNILQSPLPDLSVVGLNIQSSAFSGDTVMANWTVKNTGNQKTYRTDRFYRPSPLSDYPVMWYDRLVVTKDRYYNPESKENIQKAFYSRPHNAELEVDSIYTVVAPVVFNRCEYGTYYVFAETNYTFSTFELRYDNNALLIDSIELILQPNPDLVPTALNVTNSPASGKDIEISFTVENDGFADHTGIFTTDRFYLHTSPVFALKSATYIGQFTGPDTLVKGGNYAATVSFKVPYHMYGNCYLTVVSDMADKVCEAPNEDNNLRTTTAFNITLSPVPDLVLTLENLPDTLYAGQNVEVFAVIENIGDGLMEESHVYNTTELANTKAVRLVKYRVESGIESNSSHTDTLNLSIPLNTEEGIYTFISNADETNLVFEHTGETNNLSISRQVTVLRDNNRVPDLEVVDLKTLNTSLKGGDMVQLEVKLRNNRKSTAETGWKDQILLLDEDGFTVATYYHNHIGRVLHNETVTELVEFTIPYNISGDIQIRYVCNYDNKPVEYITSNNVFLLDVSVDAYIPPDLEPAAVSIEACCYVYAWQLDTVEVTVNNNGPGIVAGQTYLARVYLSEDEFIDRYDHLLATHQRFSGIWVNSSETIRIPVKYPSNRSGEYFILVDIDTEDDIFEGVNEDNNTLVSGYTLTLSNELTDLSVDSITITGYSGKADAFFYVDYAFSKPMADSIHRSFTNKVILTKSKTIDPTGVLVGTEKYTTLMPGGVSGFTGTVLSLVNQQIEPGYYYVGFLLDAFNEIYESDKSNNVLFSDDSFYFDFSIPLTLDIQKDTHWYEGMFAYKTYYHVNRPSGKGMIVDLEVSDKNASTEMYHRAGGIPSNLEYDHKYDNPYLADQQIVVPVTDNPVRDYIYVNPAYVPPVYNPIDPDNHIIDPVPYSILCQSAEFSVYSVYPENGSVYGYTSVSVTGFDFDSTTTFYLVRGTDTIYPVQTGLPSSSHAVLNLDLRDHSLGKYHVVAEKPAAVTRLDDGFEVQSEGFEEPWMNIDVTGAELTRRYTHMNVNFGNYANTNGYDYWLVLAITNTDNSVDHLRTSYIGSSEEELNELYGHDGNPTGDSTHVDIDGIRYFVYWIPNLPAKAQTTFTYTINHSAEDTILIYGLLFRQPMSAYTISGLPQDLAYSATMYELYDAFSENAGLLEKQSFDCNNINIAGVQRELANQTLLVAERVHGGSSTFSGAKGMKDMADKAIDAWKKDALLPFQAGSRTEEVKQKMFKDMVMEKKSITDIAKDYVKKLNPFENALDRAYTDNPPFSDLVTNVFDCIDNDDFVKEAVEKCIFCIRDDRTGEKRCHNTCNPKPRPANTDNALVRWVKSFDPNEIIGPDGTTPLRFVKQGAVMPYEIRFENKSDASAPAVKVSINNPLDSAFRLQTFRLTEIGFGDTVIQLNGVNNVNTVIELGPRYNYQLLHVVAGLDLVNNRAIWRLTTIDPVTGNPVNDPFGGFLPPNDSTGIGEGYVRYEIELKPDAVPASTVYNRADILFDQNEIIGTNTWANIVVDDNPFSVVNPLPALSGETFTVSWTGSDGVAGPGIQSYSVYVSKDDAPYVRWIANSTDTFARFTGSLGSEYKFYSIVHLTNGSVEAAPATYDAVTVVDDVGMAPVAAIGQVWIYPNPGSGYLTIHNESEASLEVTILSLDGKHAGRYEAVEIETRLDVSALPAGFYFVRVHDGVNDRIFRWIKW